MDTHTAPLNKQVVSLSSFTYLFNELVLYLAGRSKGARELEQRLFALGESIGFKVVEMDLVGEKTPRHPKLADFLGFLRSSTWKHLFGVPLNINPVPGKPHFYLIETQDVADCFYSVSKDYPSLKPATFISGLVKGILSTIGYNVTVETQIYKPNEDEQYVYHIVKETL